MTSIISKTIMIEGSISKRSDDQTPNIKNNSKEKIDKSQLTNHTQSLPSKIKIKRYTQYEKLNKIIYILIILLKILSLIFSLYIFLIGLSLLGNSFKILAGVETNRLFGFADNPIAGLTLGLLATVILQSSSSTTSITVSLVASSVLSVRNAIPIIMGANIGTSITNTIVSLGHIKNKKDFVRAFTGATVHDFFNFLAVLVLLPLELIIQKITNGPGMLEALSSVLVKPLTGGSDLPNFIKMAVKPVSGLFIKVNECIMELSSHTKIISNEAFFIDCVKNCGDKVCPNYQLPINLNILLEINNCIGCDKSHFSLISGGVFKKTKLSDKVISIITILISIIIVILALTMIVKISSYILKGRASQWLKKALGFNPYLGMLIGVGITIMVQSSSITTSTLVPLVAANVITLEQMFPLTLGANIGTTVTALIAASADGEPSGLSIALCHLFFNIFGILIWFPIPYLRQAPLECSRALGYLVGKNRLYGALYLATTFLVLPGLLFGLSLLPWGDLCGFVLIILILTFAFIWRQIRIKKPEWIPFWCPMCMFPNNRDENEIVEKSNKNDSV